MKRTLMDAMTLAGIGCALLAAGTPAARAQATPPASPVPSWADTIKFSGHAEAGITVNPDDPSTGVNFGHLFTDRANTLLLNQLLLTAERDLDPKNPNFDVGFKLQGMFGSDTRYTHFLGELDDTLKGQYQLDIVEANLTAHLPLLTAGGIDVKLGQYATPIGVEVIDAAGNFFYSHSYIFNFGIPLKHTGLLTTTHVADWLDIWAGIDSGVNTSLGHSGDNNDAVSGIGGFGLNLMGGNLTILALTHFGPENPRTVAGGANSKFRYLNDIAVTWKVNDKLTSITEINYIHDDLTNATGGGVAQYVTYALSDQLSIGGRAEIYRDDNDGGNFIVGAFPGNLDFVNAEKGVPNSSFGPGRGTTFGALTIGLNYKPPVSSMLEGLVIRPEIRYDDALNGTKTFNAGSSAHQVTIASDVIIPF